MKRNRKMKIINNEKKEKECIMEIEEKLSNLNSKTSNHDKFLEYIKTTNSLNKSIMKFYQRELFRKMKFRIFTLKQKSESKVINELKEKYGYEEVLMYGDKNIGPQIKKFISTPMIGFKRMLSNHFNVIDVDEFRTSKLDHKKIDKEIIICKNTSDNNGKKIHGVLISKILVKDS